MPASIDSAAPQVRNLRCCHSPADRERTLSTLFASCHAFECLLPSVVQSTSPHLSHFHALAARFASLLVKRRKEWNLTTTKPAPTFSPTAISSAAAADSTIGIGKESVGVRAGVGLAPDGGVGAAGGWGGLKPPKWLPDEESTFCAGCGKDFDWARRRVRTCEGGWEGGGEGDARDSGTVSCLASLVRDGITNVTGERKPNVTFEIVFIPWKCSKYSHAVAFVRFLCGCGGTLVFRQTTRTIGQEYHSSFHPRRLP